jgi:DNA-binding XRE family transcriptional regulator
MSNSSNLSNMSNNEWQTVTNGKKSKQSKQVIPVNFDPIISRQQEALAKANQEKISNGQVVYGAPQDAKQDWNYISIGKAKTISKPKGPTIQSASSGVKTNRDGEIVGIKKVSKEMAQSIVSARVSKQWTQVQLAHNSGVDVKTINEIERSGCIYEPGIFNKISKALGITIERNYIMEQKVN